MVILICTAWSAYYFKQKFSYLGIGRKSDRLNNIGKRTGIFIKRVLFQRFLFRRPITGLMHALVFWGFCVFTIATLSRVTGAFTLRFSSVPPSVRRTMRFWT